MSTYLHGLQRAWIIVAFAATSTLAFAALLLPDALYAGPSSAPSLPLRLLLLGTTLTGAMLGIAIVWRAFDAAGCRALALGLATILLALDLQLLGLPALRDAEVEVLGLALTRGAATVLLSLGLAGLLGFIRAYPHPLDWDEHFAANAKRVDELRKRRGRGPGRLVAWLTARSTAGVATSLDRDIDTARFVRGILIPALEAPWFWIGGAALGGAAWTGMQLAEARRFAVVLVSVWTYLFLIPAVLSILVLSLSRHEFGDAEERRRLQWLKVGLLTAAMVQVLPLTIALVVAAIRTLVPAWADRIQAIDPTGVAFCCAVSAVWIWLLGLAVSIFFSGSGDPRLVLRRSVLYTSIGAGFSASFVVLQGVFATGTVSRLGGRGETSALLAGALVTLVFGSLRTRADRAVEGLVERMMPATDLAEGARSVRAIVFSDLSGYTALSARDERSALTLASLFQKENRRAAEAGRGRLVKTIGDAVMLEFPNVDAALTAWRDALRGYAAAAAKLGIEPLPVHTGLHLGAVVAASDGDVYGAAVNLAARLQGQAGHWELVSSATAAAASVEPGFEPLGALTLKNVPAPVECVRLKLAPS